MLELEKLRSENLELQQTLKQGYPQQPSNKYGGSDMLSADEGNRLRKEVHLLENLVHELRAELKNKRPQTANANQDWEDEKIDLEVRL
jgi:hypothetical protein